MTRLIEALATLIIASIVVVCGNYSLKHIAFYCERLALEKAAQPMNSLETAAQKMTGTKLNF